MRFMVMHKTTAKWEAEDVKPTPEEMQRVGAMVGELQRSGALLSGEGLGRSAEGARVRLSKGQRTVTPGPFDGDGALPARYTLFRAESVDQAAELAARFGRIFGDVVVDVRPVNEMWDLGFAPKPEGLTTRRYMAVVNADAASEAGTKLTPDQLSALKAFTEDLGRSGAFLGMEHFEPSAKGKRIQQSPGTPKAKRVVRDGPFTETKELIGGFVILELGSIEEAVRIAENYMDVVEVHEIDIRGLEERSQG